MNILILGATGQVGIELKHAAWPTEVEVHAPDRAELDLTDEAALNRAVASRKWACVINAAAYTAVDAAETEIVAAWRINALAPAILASATSKADTPIVHVSTDYVFDGQSRQPYLPDDPVRPQNVYGASKAAGEQAIRTGNPRHVIVRTAWVVSPHRANFVKTMLRLAAERDVLRVVDDQTGCPTSASDLAAALMRISMCQAADPLAPCGTYHFVNAGQTTWCGFAREIMVGADKRGARAIAVQPIATVDYKTPAGRPVNSALSTESLVRDYDIRSRPWQQALDDILDILIPAKSSGIGGA